MVTLDNFKFEWRALNDALNKIVDAVNRNSPLEGDQISLDEKGTTGVSINVSAQTHGSDTSTQGGGGAVAGGPMEGSWLTVTIVDPATCAQSQIQVWSRPVPL